MVCETTTTVNLCGMFFIKLTKYSLFLGSYQLYIVYNDSAMMWDDDDDGYHTICF
jgi:hypothetical protein